MLATTMKATTRLSIAAWNALSKSGQEKESTHTGKGRLGPALSLPRLLPRTGLPTAVKRGLWLYIHHRSVNNLVQGGITHLCTQMESQRVDLSVCQFLTGWPGEEPMVQTDLTHARRTVSYSVRHLDSYKTTTTDRHTGIVLNRLQQSHVR